MISISLFYFCKKVFTFMNIWITGKNSMRRHYLKKVKETCQFDEDFIKSYNNDSDEGCFLEVDVQYPKNLHNLHNDLLFFHKRMKIENSEKLVANLNDKKYMLYT